MKKPAKILACVLVAAILSSFLILPASTDSADVGWWGFTPRSTQTYGSNADFTRDRGGSTVSSYLIREDGYYVRVEYDYSFGGVLFERYAPDFTFVSGRVLSLPEGVRWGGAYFGDEAYYIVVGWSNYDQSDSAEVIRVIRFDKNWNVTGQASVYGENTYVPFSSGSLRFAEYGGMLYIHTCHTMYDHGDGLHHQANMTLAVRESDMTVAGVRSDVSNISTGYVSHSFDQYIIVDSDGNLVTLDHGDAYPRAAVLQKYKEKAGVFLPSSRYGTYSDNIHIRDFPGAIGDNTTGASLGGLVETSTGYVTVYNYNGIGANSSGSVMGVATSDPRFSRDVYVSYTPKNNFTSGATITRKITNYPVSETESIGAPRIVPTGPDGGWIFWEGMTQVKTLLAPNVYGINYYFSGVISYCRYNADGTVGEIRTAEGRLSNCAPTVIGGKVMWYTTERSTPVFYVLDGGVLTAHATGGNGGYIGVSLSSEDGSSTDGLTLTLSGGGITMTGTVTNGSCVFNDIPNGVYTITFAGGGGFAAQRWTLELTNGEIVAFFSIKRGNTTFPPDPGEEDPPDPGDDPGGAVSTVAFSDVRADAYYADPVVWAVDNDITAGTGGGKFSPEAGCTRGQVVTFLWRAAGKPSPSGTGNPFYDVHPDDYYYRAVLWAVENGITAGTSKTTFSPDAVCTRGQIVAFLWRAAGSPPPSGQTDPFSDVVSSDYYADAVLWAVGKGITKGTSATSFSPGSDCTRGQIVTFLYRAYK